VVIVGAGHAGVQVAASLREEGYSGAIKLLSAEPHLPYQRPPLSKAFLKGAMEAEGLPLRAAQFYPDKDIDLLLGEEAVEIDRRAQRLTLASGKTLDYGHLVLATGARQRPLEVPGIGLDGVLTLRDLSDARTLRERLGGARRIVVIGAGFIGLEIAATATSLGGEVTIVELAPRPLGRAVSPATSAFFLEAHRVFGAQFHLGLGVAALHGRDGALTEVELSNGERLPADIAVIGIGVLPEDRLAQAAGLACENGIVVNASLESSDPLISAVGDCASNPCRTPSIRPEQSPAALSESLNPMARSRGSGATRAISSCRSSAFPTASINGFCAAIRKRGLSRPLVFERANSPPSRRSIGRAITWRRAGSSAPDCRSQPNKPPTAPSICGSSRRRRRNNGPEFLNPVSVPVISTH
jgi:NADPH-dependent 2,4-dienoyl-CoA reductase/sulfur reductase-like enzyme